MYDISISMKDRITFIESPNTILFIMKIKNIYINILH